MEKNYFLLYTKNKSATYAWLYFLNFEYSNMITHAYYYTIASYIQLSHSP